MGAQLRIDSDETYGLAAEMASLRGESIGDAVTRALREALERDQVMFEPQARKERVEERIKQITAIADEVCINLRHLLPPFGDDGLYEDELGLPK